MGKDGIDAGKIDGPIVGSGVEGGVGFEGLEEVGEGFGGEGGDDVSEDEQVVEEVALLVVG